MPRDAAPADLRRSAPRRTWPVALLALLLTAAAGTADSPPAPAEQTSPIQALGAAPMPTITLDELTVGQRGYGLTVFTGSEPERFEAEVIGVMRNLSPESSFILARLSGRGLEEIGVAGGMSGSPVFFDGKLAGAVAFSWPFSSEPIAGITPIHAMRDIPAEAMPPAVPWDVHRPLPADGEAPEAASAGASAGSSRPLATLAELASGRLAEDLLERRLALLAPDLAGGALPGIQWSLGGFGARTESLLQDSLGQRSVAAVAPMGRMGAVSGTAEELAAELAPGSPVAAVLIDGDLTMAGTGTVTDVIDGQVLAFGHPFLGLGPIHVPMAAAEVVTVLSSSYSSFKIANVGPKIGSFRQDRAAGIRGALGEPAPTVPLLVRVRGESEREFRMELAAMPALTPSLMAVASLGSLDAASYAGGVQGLDVKARFQLAGRSDLWLEQSFDGDGAATQAVVLLLGYASFLLENEMEAVEIERIDIEIEQSPGPRTATLVGAHADRAVVRPGESVRLNLDFKAYRGERFRRSMEVALPPSLPEGSYYLFVGDGSSIDAARLALEQIAPETLDQALDFLSSLHTNRELVVLGVRRAAGLNVGGEVMPHLPGSVRSLWSDAGSSAKKLELAIIQEVGEEMPMPITGLLRVDLKVDRRLVLGASDGVAEPLGESTTATGQASAEAATGAD